MNENDEAEEKQGEFSGTLRFDLNVPECQKRMTRMLQVEDLYSALWDISQDVFRKRRKYGDEPMASNAEEMEREFYEILTAHGINLDGE